MGTLGLAAGCCIGYFGLGAIGGLNALCFAIGVIIGLMIFSPFELCIIIAIVVFFRRLDNGDSLRRFS